MAVFYYSAALCLCVSAFRFADDPKENGRSLSTSPVGRQRQGKSFSH